MSARDDRPTQAAETDEVLTYQTAAAFLCMSKRSLELLVAQRRVPFLPVPGSRTRPMVRFAKSDLLNWLRNRRRAVAGKKDAAA